MQKLLFAAQPTELRPATISQTVRIDQANGDSYIGTVVAIHSTSAVLSNYSAWYVDTAEPFSSPYVDDTVQLAITDETRVTTF